MSTVLPDRRALFALHVDPTFGKDGAIDGIMCAAIDISRIRSLESEQRRLTDELGTAAAALRNGAARLASSRSYTQDREPALHHRSASRMFGREADEIIGRTDEDILPADSRAPIVALKRGVLEVD